MSSANNEGQLELLRAHYERVGGYDERIDPHDAHFFALGVMVGLFEYLGVRSVLDIGSGMGRTLLYLRDHAPDVRRLGVEPSADLRRAAHTKGVLESEIVDGDGSRLPFTDGSFDLVCAFAVLHHVPKSQPLLAEMLRVANKAVFISDSNNYGQGRPLARMIKQTLRLLHLWKLADLVRTRGKGYQYNEHEGVFYSYSLLDDFDFLRARCSALHLVSTQAGGMNLLRTAPHVAVLGLK